MHEKFIEYAHDQIKGPGKVGERIVDKAIIRAETMPWDGLTGDVNKFNGKILPQNKTLDFGIIHKKTDIPLGVEVKNIREWVYASSDTVWELLGKCAYFEVLPVLITIQISYTTLRDFKKIGLIGFTTYKQFFHPDLQNEKDLKLIKSKDGLCFKDINFTTDPSPELIKFFSTRIPNNIETYNKTFMENLSLIKTYAIEKDMWNPNMNSQRRQTLYEEFKRELFGWNDNETTYNEY